MTLEQVSLFYWVKLSCWTVIIYFSVTELELLLCPFKVYGKLKTELQQQQLLVTDTMNM